MWSDGPVLPEKLIDVILKEPGDALMDDLAEPQSPDYDSDSSDSDADI